MRLLVYLRDGRTCYLLEGRSAFRKLVGEKPWHEEKSLRVVRGIWNPTTGEYVWQVIYLRWIAKGTISVVEEARGIADTVEQAAA